MKVKIKTRLSNTDFKERIRRKTSPEIAETIKISYKNEAWRPVAKILSNSTQSYSSVNLKQIDEQTTPGDTVLVIGKVLGSGDLTKKVRICALSISESALAKLKATKSEFASIKDEIKINPKFSGVKLIR